MEGARVERRRQRDYLERGARRVERLRGAVDEGSRGVALEEVADVGVVVRGRGRLGEHRAGLGVEHHDGARVALQRLLGCLLDARVDGEDHRVAGLFHAGKRVEGALPVGVVGVPGEGVVHGGLDAGGAVLRGEVAHRVRGQRALRVGAHEGAIGLLQRLGKRHAVGREDGATLHVLALLDGVVVVGQLLVVVGLDHLDVGEVGDEQRKEQREEGHERREAVAQGHAAQDAALHRAQREAAAGVLALHHGRGAGGAAKHEAAGPVGAVAGGQHVSAGALVAAAQQQAHDDEARE